MKKRHGRTCLCRAFSKRADRLLAVLLIALVLVVLVAFVLIALVLVVLITFVLVAIVLVVLTIVVLHEMTSFCSIGYRSIVAAEIQNIHEKNKKFLLTNRRAADILNQQNKEG